MMAGPRSVLVIPERTRGCAPFDLVSRSTTLAQDAGGPVVRAVIFVSPDATEPQPQILAQYPRLVAHMSRMQALAYSANADWDKFLVIDSTEQTWVAALMTRSTTGFVESRIDCGGAEAQCDAKKALLSAVLRCLGVEKCLLAGEAQVPFEDLLIERTANRAVFDGALAFASETLGMRGVSVTEQETAMRASRAVKYSVLHPERNVFDALDLTLADLAGTRPLFFVFDKRVGAIYASAWRRYARHHDLQVAGEIALDLSERSKTLREVDEICAAAAAARLSRNAIVVGIGGGITLDVAGLAASLFRRGTDYVRIPTSLVGLVDVAVGIKQGVNAYGRKNLIGSFYPPLASINDYRFLHTLPVCEIACGFAEIVKVAALRDPALFRLLETHARELRLTKFAAPASIALEVTRRAELLMLEELAPNLFEDDYARLVDFGHTFSPAMEVASHFEIPHGYAVALDMLFSAALAVTLGWSESTWLGRLASLFTDIGLPVWDERVPATDELLAALADVRRHRGGALNLVVVSEPGVPHFVSGVSRAQVAAARVLVAQLESASADTDVEVAEHQFAAKQQEGGYARAAV